MYSVLVPFDEDEQRARAQGRMVRRLASTAEDVEATLLHVGEMVDPTELAAGAHLKETLTDAGIEVRVATRSGDPVETIREEIGHVDAGIEVVGKVQTIEQAHALTGRGGNTLIFGVPDQDATMEVSPFDIYFDEVDLRGTFALSQESFERAVGLLRTGRIDADAMVTEEIGLDDIPSAFERMERAEGLKKVVRPGKPSAE